MPTTHTLVIGAGQAGLAMSRCLTDVGIDHVVLERGRTAERWRRDRWDSLRLLTPNWASRLPGWTYQGPEPDGYMTAGELATYLTDYAGSFDAPIEEHSDVCAAHAGPTRASRSEPPPRRGLRATSSSPPAGATSPACPASRGGCTLTWWPVTPSSYRNPDQLPDGVLVVGASATGVQLADELARAGREVVLAVGRHSRVPRRYRGMDIWWWLDQIGTFARTIDDVGDATQARDEGALQLVGRDDRRDVDLPALQGLGVRLTGRLVGIDGHELTFADDLVTTTTAADERLVRLLARIDDHITANGLDAEVLRADNAGPPPPDRTGRPPRRPSRRHCRRRVGHRLPPSLPVAPRPRPRPPR